MGFFERLFAPRTPPEAARKLGRNARCWCGSDQKYKNCHLNADRRYFNSVKAPTCTSYG